MQSLSQLLTGRTSCCLRCPRLDLPATTCVPAFPTCSHNPFPGWFTLTLNLHIKIELSFLVLQVLGTFSEAPELNSGTVLLIFSLVTKSWGLCHWQPRAGVVGQIGQGLFPGHWIPLLVVFLVFLDPSSGLSLSIFCPARPQTHSHPAKLAPRLAVDN